MLNELSHRSLSHNRMETWISVQLIGHSYNDEGESGGRRKEVIRDKGRSEGEFVWERGRVNVPRNMQFPSPFTSNSSKPNCRRRDLRIE